MCWTRRLWWVDYVAEQVGPADPSCLKQYVERRATRFEHQAEIVTVYGYVSAP
jgi:hypothetical protein